MGITPKKKTPSYFGGLFVSQVKYAQRLRCLVDKKVQKNGLVYHYYAGGSRAFLLPWMGRLPEPVHNGDTYSRFGQGLCKNNFHIGFLQFVKGRKNLCRIFLQVPFGG